MVEKRLAETEIGKRKALNEDKVIIRDIEVDKNQSQITIREISDRPGLASLLFDALGKEKIVVDVIIQNVSHQGLTDITFTVDKKDAEKAEEITKKVAKEIEAKGVERKDNIAKVSIVGLGMRNHFGTAGKMFSILADENINIYAISTSEVKISCLIDEDKAEEAKKALGRAFEKDEEIEIER
jgi:aspartate kinase